MTIQNIDVKRMLLGVHSIVVRDYVPYGGVSTDLHPAMYKVIEDTKIDLSEKLVMAKGGQSRDNYSAAVIDANGKLTFTVKEFSAAMLKHFTHNALTTTAAATSGTLTTIANVVGTSVMSATTGITATATLVTATVPAKEGIWDIVCITATTISVEGVSDIDGVTMSDETVGLVTPTPLTVVTGQALSITPLGIKVTGGSGTIGMTIGDRARITILRPNAGSIDVPIGGENNKGYKEVFIFFGENEERDVSYVQFYRCAVGRGPWTTKVKDYATAGFEIEVTKDPKNPPYVGTFHSSYNNV